MMHDGVDVGLSEAGQPIVLGKGSGESCPLVGQRRLLGKGPPLVLLEHREIHFASPAPEELRHARRL
jgi:hypothetical protein